MTPHQRLRHAASLGGLCALAACTYDFDSYVSEGGNETSLGGVAGASSSGGALATGGNTSGGAAAGGGVGGIATGGVLTSGGTTSTGGEAGTGGTGFDCDALAGTVWNGHCYFAIGRGTGLYWNDARDACEAYGDVHLVTVTSAEEQQAIEDAFFPTTDDHWIGLSLANTSSSPSSSCDDDPDSCPFLWVTGETLDFTEWAAHNATDLEPNYTGACVRIQFDDLDWADYGCDQARLPAICETD